MMTTIEFDNWMFLGGVRAENTGTTYRGNRTLIDENEQFAGRRANGAKVTATSISSRWHTFVTIFLIGPIYAWPGPMHCASIIH
jgi:hypothetical protein